MRFVPTGVLIRFGLCLRTEESSGAEGQVTDDETNWFSTMFMNDDDVCDFIITTDVHQISDDEISTVESSRSWKDQPHLLRKLLQPAARISRRRHDDLNNVGDFKPQRMDLRDSFLSSIRDKIVFFLEGGRDSWCVWESLPLGLVPQLLNTHHLRESSVGHGPGQQTHPSPAKQPHPQAVPSEALSPLVEPLAPLVDVRTPHAPSPPEISGIGTPFVPVLAVSAS